MNLNKYLGINRMALFILIILIMLVPLFSYASELVNYSEPMDKLAESFQVEDKQVYTGVFYDYTVPGINSYVGSVVCAIVGMFTVLFLTNIIVRIITKRNEDHRKSTS